MSLGVGLGLGFKARGLAVGSPALTGATLVASFDARMSTVTLNAGKVTNIASTVGAFNAVATGAAGTRPTWNTSSAAFGGPSFSFDGIDDFLKITGINAGSQTLIYMTLKPTAWVLSSYVMSATGVKSTIYQNGSEPSYQIYNGSPGNLTQIATGGAKRLWAYFNGASSEIKGGSIRNAGADTGAGTGADLYIASAGGASNFCALETDLIQVYTAASMPSMTDLEAWLSARNGASFLT